MYIHGDGVILRKLRLKKWSRGSYTIEASLLLPFIFFVLIYFIYFAFYLHDKEVINHVAYETAFVGSVGGFIEKSTFREYDKEELLEYSYSRIDKILISTNVRDITVEKGNGKIKVSIFGEFLNPLSNGFGISLLMDKEINIIQTVKIQNSPTYLKRGQVMLEKIKRVWE